MESHTSRNLSHIKNVEGELQALKKLLNDLTLRMDAFADVGQEAQPRLERVESSPQLFPETEHAQESVQALEVEATRGTLSPSEIYPNLDKKMLKLRSLTQKLQKSRDVEITRFWLGLAERLYRASTESEDASRSYALAEAADAVLEGATEVLLRGGR